MEHLIPQSFANMQNKLAVSKLYFRSPHGNFCWLLSKHGNCTFENAIGKSWSCSASASLLVHSNASRTRSEPGWPVFSSASLCIATRGTLEVCGAFADSLWMRDPCFLFTVFGVACRVTFWKVGLYGNPKDHHAIFGASLLKHTPTEFRVSALGFVFEPVCIFASLEMCAESLCQTRARLEASAARNFAFGKAG